MKVNESAEKGAADDNRTIADMNVEGMPWYMDGDKERAERRQAASAGKYGPEELDREQMRMYTWGALKAALLVALVFGAAFFLFLLFCDFVWFR